MFVAALGLAAVFPFSRYVFPWLRSINRGKLSSHARPDHPENSTDPRVLLTEANRGYWLNNGPRAAPLYARAESQFRSRGDALNELYAKIGRLRSEAETMSFVELSRFLGERLQNPIVVNDAELRLWYLAAKGYTDIEIDYQTKSVTG